MPAGDPAGGQFTSGGGGSGGGSSASPDRKGVSVAPKAKQYVSPSIVDKTFDQALSDLFSERQTTFAKASAEIDDKLGLAHDERSAVGAWSDGAENSIVIAMPKATFAEARLSGAMKGWLANQKSVLVFSPDEKGLDYLATFPIKGKLDKVHDELLKDGIAFHTLEPASDGNVIVHVFGKDRATAEKINEAAKKNGTQAEFTAGHGEFIGTHLEGASSDEQRADARREYESIINDAIGAGLLTGRDIAKTWREVRDRWGGSFAEAKKGLTEADFAKADIHVNSTVIAEWNDRIGESPEAFHKEYFGGLPGELSISGYGGTWDCDGRIRDPKDKDRFVATVNRTLNWDDKESHLDLFSITRTETGIHKKPEESIGKRVMGTSIPMLARLGFEKETLYANIDVGGHAWARYGYTPLPYAWSDLRRRLDARMNGGSFHVNEPTLNPVEEWALVGNDDRDRIQRAWEESTRDEFLQSEIDNWRENDAPDEGAATVAENFNDGSDTDWLAEAFEEHINGHDTTQMVTVESGERLNAPLHVPGRVEAGLPRIPYTIEQLIAAVQIEHDRGDGAGYGSSGIMKGTSFSWDDDKLKEPDNLDTAQGTLPGIEPREPSESLTPEMRADLEAVLEKAFIKESEHVADRLDAPDYLAENVSEYQSEYWTSKSESDKYDWASRNNELPEYEVEQDDEENTSREPVNPTASLQTLIDSSNPRAIWAIADSDQGKDLLLDQNWDGVLRFDDKDAMDRLTAYCAKAKVKPNVTA